MMTLLALQLWWAHPAIGQSATNWPEADRLFHQDPRWLGGDAAFSIDLGHGRVLWLFGDSFVAAENGQNRASCRMVRNSVAIEDGYDPSRASMRFYWKNQGGEGQSFFPEFDGHWLWPLHGAKLGNKLLLFFNVIDEDKTPRTLGFKGVGNYACLVENVDESPDHWKWQPLVLSPNPWKITLGSSLLLDKEYVYIFGFDEPEHHVYLTRFARKQNVAAALLNIQWWSKADRSWITQNDLKRRPEPIFDDGGTEFSVSFDKKRQLFIEVQSMGFGASKIVMRKAKSITGPWDKPVELFCPPESRQTQPFVYAGKAHEELCGADIVATYATNGNLKRLVEDMHIYFPRFVRIKMPE